MWWVPDISQLSPSASFKHYLSIHFARAALRDAMSNKLRCASVHDYLLPYLETRLWPFLPSIMARRSLFRRHRQSQEIATLPLARLIQSFEGVDAKVDDG